MLYRNDDGFFKAVATPELVSNYVKYEDRCKRCMYLKCTSAEKCFECDNGKDNFLEDYLERDVNGIEWIVEQLDKMDLDVYEITMDGFEANAIVTCNKVDEIAGFFGEVIELRNNSYKSCVHNGIMYVEENDGI